jgi:transposase-like protein
VALLSKHAQNHADRRARALHRGLVDGTLSADMKLRSSKYLNNLIEQKQDGAKFRIGPMLGL